MPGQFSGSGGGVFGAIARAVIADAGLNGFFQGRVRTGLGEPYSEFPWLQLTTVRAKGTRQSDGLILTQSWIQVATYAEGYDAAWAIGLDVDGFLAGHRLLVGGREVVLFLDIPGEGMLFLNPDRSEAGAEVWTSPSRYRLQQTRTPGPEPGIMTPPAA